MNALTKLAPAEPMTIEQFLAFTATRPPEERWELIEGVAILNPSPVDWHQHIVGNILSRLLALAERRNTGWMPIIGTGTRTPSSPNSLPQPDVMVKEHALTGTPASDDGVVVVEVLSRSNTKAWREWRRANYPSIPNCQHYFTVSMRRVEVLCYDRTAGWRECRLTSLSEVLELTAIGVALPLADIYRRTPLAAGEPVIEQRGVRGRRSQPSRGTTRRS